MMNMNSRGYVVVRNSEGCEIGCFEVDTSKAIAQELISVINVNCLIFQEGDTISFESK